MDSRMKSEKVFSYDDMIEKCLEFEKNNQKYLITNGCFDIIHSSHINNLKQCSSYGVPVVLFINSDEAVRKLKGDGRPYFNLENRLFTISSIMYVDYVSSFDSTDLCDIFRKIKPTYWAKGSDRNLETLNQEERRLAEKNNTQIVFIDNLNTLSSTEIIIKINQEKNNE